MATLALLRYPQGDRLVLLNGTLIYAEDPQDRGCRLLKILNERVFENDGELVKVPLKLCVAASNEWPPPESGKELSALMDRFLFRKTVRPIVSGAGRQRLLWHRDHTPKLSTTITPEEIE